MRTLHMYLRNCARDSESCNCARLVQILVPIPARLAPSHLPRLLFHQASEILKSCRSLLRSKEHPRIQALEHQMSVRKVRIHRAPTCDRKLVASGMLASLIADSL